jgi:hypothetical protein
MWKSLLNILCSGAALCLVAGCSSMSQTPPDDAASKPYKDPASGVVFPVQVSALNRISMDTDDSGKNPVSAHYTAAQPLHTPENNIGLMRPNLAFYLNAEVIVEPSARANPDQTLGQTMRDLQKNPNFVQEDFRGMRTFGSVTADCAQCSFDRPAWGDRATFKAVIVPRGAYLICFTFLFQASQEKDWQAVMDSFVQGILTQSTGPVLMAPED